MGHSYGAESSQLTTDCACCTDQNSINIIASDQSWIEGEAIRQLQETARLPGITRAVGHPDLHPGKGIPVGASFLAEGVIYPHLVGNDIGCGMGLWRTDIAVHKFKLDKTVKKLKGFEEAYDDDVSDLLDATGLSSEDAGHSLGTIGGGNHFAEFQTVETIFNAEVAERMGLDAKSVHLLVHSGSRGLGEAILRRHVDRYRAQGLKANTDAFDAYIERHDKAVLWAEVNRKVIARRFMEKLNTDGECLLDICHNSVTPQNGLWLHRKGAAPSDNGAVVIPGSRGAITYVVMPKTERAEAALWSLAHGAGRKWKRSDVKARLSKRYSVSELTKTKLGGRVICEDKALIFEEAPEAYKDIEEVINALTNAGLIEPVAAMRPLITYKTRRR